jgi:3-methyl-2-oxobutanoate hydroxymethyltransferase
MSYQADPSDAIKNAGRFLTEGLADVVKVEADQTHAALIERMTRSGIPICGHVGSRPQLAALSGGYTPAGRTQREADQIVADAVALERAGSVMLLIEAVPEEVTTRVLQATTVPLIGIGAGPACHGQVLVLQDLLGMTQTPPRFAEPLAHLGPAIESAAVEWTRRVSQRQVGGQRYEMKTQPTPGRGIQTDPASERSGKDASAGPRPSPMKP